MVASGDFRQLPVVVKEGGRPEVLQACVKASPLWANFRRMCLTGASMRVKDDPDFAAWIESVGNGTAPHVDRTGQQYPDQEARRREGGPHTILLPPSLFSRVKIFTDEAAFVAHVHPAHKLGASDAVKSCIVCPHNNSVDAHNTAVLKVLRPATAPLQLVAYESMPEQSGVEWALASDEFMAHVHAPGSPGHSLDVKPGCLITCIRNLAPHMGVINGSRLEVLSAHRHVILARQLYAPFAVVAIPRLVFDIPIPKSDICVARRQFPVRVAYACTCHKVQGATMPSVVGLDLRRACFAHGQLYCGCSRVTCALRLAFLVNPEDVVVLPDGSRALLLNSVVYPELLSEAIEIAEVPAAALRPAPYYPPLDDPADVEERDAFSAWLGAPRASPHVTLAGAGAGAGAGADAGDDHASARGLPRRLSDMDDDSCLWDASAAGFHDSDGAQAAAGSGPQADVASGP